MSVFERMLGKLYGDPIKSELGYRRVYKYLDRYVKQLGKEMPEGKCNADVKIDKTIWVLWFQGIDKAPALVRRCYESVCENKPDDFDVVLLSEKNLDDYVKLPDYIWKKHKKGIISRTHLSDILRVELLYNYGGCWIDSTVYCSEKIPRYLIEGDFFMFRGSLHNKSVHKGSNWWIYAKQNIKLVRDMRELYFLYWKNEVKLRDYYLFHIMLSKLTDIDNGHRAMFFSMPYVNNSNSHVFYGKLGLGYDEKIWEHIKTISPIHKLSYKKRFIQGDLDTFYMRLIEKKLV